MKRKPAVVEAVPVVMQRENECSRVVLDGRRIEDGQRCSYVVIGERNGEVGGEPAPSPRVDSDGTGGDYPG